MRGRHDNGLTVIAILSVAFAAVQWGSQGVKFGVSLLFVAFISFMCGEEYGRGPRAINAVPRLARMRRALRWVDERWYHRNRDFWGLVLVGLFFTATVALMVWVVSE